MKYENTLTAGQFARRLGVSATRVAQLRRAGRIVAQRTPLGFLYRERDLSRLEAERALRAKRQA